MSQYIISLFRPNFLGGLQWHAIAKDVAICSTVLEEFHDVIFARGMTARYFKDVACLPHELKGSGGCGFAYSGSYAIVPRQGGPSDGMALPKRRLHAL